MNALACVAAVVATAAGALGVRKAIDALSPRLAAWRHRRRVAFLVDEYSRGRR